MKMVASNIEIDDQDYLTKINDEAELIALNLLPKKYADVYLRLYDKFMEWKKKQKIDEKSISESVMLVYFNNIKTKYKASSMWVEYSMLKTMIARNHNINVKYDKLTAFLKKNSVGFRPKKSNIFQPEDIRKFLSAADDANFLPMKMIMIFGVYGATRADELCNPNKKPNASRASIECSTSISGISIPLPVTSTCLTLSQSNITNTIH